MTPAEIFANSAIDLERIDGVWELPRSSHVIATVFGVVGGFAGFAVGTPVGAVVGAIATAAVGYGIYWAVEALTGGPTKSKSDAQLQERFLEFRSRDDRPLSRDELLGFRRGTP